MGKFRTLDIKELVREAESQGKHAEVNTMFGGKLNLGTLKLTLNGKHKSIFTNDSNKVSKK